MSGIIITREGASASFDVFGPPIEFLTVPEQADSRYCVMMGTMPPGVAGPLHSHPDLESFFLISGRVQALSERGEKPEWQDVKAGEFVYVPSDAKHAWRNTSSEPAVMLITTTPRLGRFFREIGRRVSAGAFLPAPTPTELEQLARVSARYDYWIASPAENAAVGINLLG